jgi:hypothetical protein
MMGCHIGKNELDIGKLTRQSLECNKQQTGRTLGNETNVIKREERSAAACITL